ncbi:MAG: AAA family ATPase, partial [Planctomycetota bacterium]
MRITDLHVDGFGVWTDLRLKRLSPELTVFYGPNEAGKTTLMQFLRTMLYGVDTHRRARYLPPVHGGRPGGRLGVLGEGGPFEVTRYTDRDPATVEGVDRGLVRVNLPGGETEGDRRLRDALDGIDEPTFNNVFAVGLDEIQALGTLKGAQVAKHIYRLTSGLDRVSLYDVIMDLRQSRDGLLAGPGEPSLIGDLVAQRDQLRLDISDLAIQNRRWSKLAVELDETEKQVAAARDELKAAERAARRIEVAITLKPLWRDRLKVDDRLEEYASLFRLPAGAIDQLDAFNAEVQEHRRQRDILRGQRKQLAEEADE